MSSADEIEEGEHKPWRDKGYVRPTREISCEGLAILDAENYNGLKNLDLDLAKLHFSHELPQGYKIIAKIGHGAFGCCFLVEKQTDYIRILNANDETLRLDSYKPFQVVLKVVRGMIEPRRPVLFYKTCSDYTIMITFKAFPLIIENLEYILGMLKFLHTRHEEVHGDLNPTNMLYFCKDITKNLYLSQRFAIQSGLIRMTHSAKTQVHVLYDFVDDWFFLGDEAASCIIDPDIGGKIGEAKTVVNHLHHDPRNATWQVSDDLIGLMNWVVLTLGYHVQSHDTRGMVYETTLESLRQLYAHIIYLYEHLNNDFIFHYLRAPEEPFNLKLKPGKCYLDELLMGEFLNFESFEGSYSMASNTSKKVTSCVRYKVLEVLQATPVKQEDLYQIFTNIASDEYLSTLNKVLNLLTSANMRGGALFVILDKEFKDDLQISSLDNRLLTQFCRSKFSSVHKENFGDLLHAVCSPNTTDRWEQSQIEDLAVKVNCEDITSQLAELNRQPKDGAFVVSCRGTILSAAAHLKFLPQQYQLCTANGTQFGTRHAAALATAEWMRLKDVSGAVLVRSDAGGVHVMLPHGQTALSDTHDSKESRSPWVTKDGQKLPQVLCVKEALKKEIQTKRNIPGSRNDQKARRSENAEERKCIVL